MVCQKCMYQGIILDESVKHAQMQCCNVANVFLNVQPEFRKCWDVF